MVSEVTQLQCCLPDDTQPPTSTTPIIPALRTTLPE